MKIVKQDLLSKKPVFENLMKWGLKGGFQWNWASYLDMYLDAAVVFVNNKSLLLFRIQIGYDHAVCNYLHE